MTMTFQGRVLGPSEAETSGMNGPENPTNDLAGWQWKVADGSWTPCEAPSDEELVEHPDKFRPVYTALVVRRCFHCDDVFTDKAAAHDHFGFDEGCTPACKLASGLAGMVTLIREQEDELRNHRMEETASYREFYALGADHSQALRREEEKGYARGLRDGTKEASARVTELLQSNNEFEERARKAERAMKGQAPAIAALREWLGFQSTWNTTTLYNAAGKLFGSTFNPAEYDAVE